MTRRSAGGARARPLVAGAGAVGAVVGAVWLATLGLSVPAAAATAVPAVTLTPASPRQGYADQQVVTVSVPTSSLFHPGRVVEVLECADPGGKPANLPVDDSSCDGTTQGARTVFFAHDGSARVPGYQLFELPNAALGEQANSQPACGTAAVPCVLYVGEDHTDFTLPHVFSAPFVFDGPPAKPFSAAAAGAGGPGAGSAAAGSTVSTAPSSDPATASGAGVSVGPTGALAFTGPSWSAVVACCSGVLLAGAGMLGRRRLSARRLSVHRL